MITLTAEQIDTLRSLQETGTAARRAQGATSAAHCAVMYLADRNVHGEDSDRDPTGYGFT
jgi:hypothetical protein